MVNRKFLGVLLGGIAAFILSCGSENFLDVEQGDADSLLNPDGTINEDVIYGDFGDKSNGVLGGVIGDGPNLADNKTNPNNNDNDNGGDDNPTPNPNPDPNPNPKPKPVIPNISGDDLNALHACLEKWQSHPFGDRIENVKKISAAVTVGGMGVAVNDTEYTDQPRLVLISAAVNVGGEPVYNMLNPNGYYCMKVNVNVGTSLNINLHCNARLADSKVGVNIGSVMNDETSSIGVHVASRVSVNTIRPQGDQCMR